MEGKFNQITRLNLALQSMEHFALCCGLPNSDVHTSKWIIIKLELRLLEMFMWGLAYWEDLEYDWHLRFAINTMMPKFGQLAEEFEVDLRCVENQVQVVIFDAIIYDLEKAIKQFRRQIKDICIHLLGGSFKCTSAPFNLKKFGEYERDISSFIDLIQMNLRALQISNLIAPVMKQQIALIQRGLEEFGMHVDPPNRLFDFIPITRAWLNSISFLTCLYWIDGNDESLASNMETILQVLLRKTLPCTTSGVISSHFQPKMTPQLLSRHLNFLLGVLVLHVKGDVEILEEALIFMLSFILDPPDVDSKDREIIWAQIYSTTNKFSSLIYSIRSCEMEEELFKANFSAFLVKVDRVKAKVKGLFFGVPYSLQFTSPINNGIASFLNILEVNLVNMLERKMNLIPCSKHLCETLRTEIESFGPFLKNIMELLEDDRDKEVEDLWMKTLNMIYNVDYFIRLCLIGRFSTWYGIIALPDVIEHIKFIKIQINTLVGVDKIHNKKKIDGREQMEGNDALRPRGMEGTENDSMGFEEVEENIINDLTRGRMSLTVISISGSGGQGKTTLAKRIYDNSNVQCRFQKVVWCYVSKDFCLKDLLIQIMCDNAKGDGATELEIKNTMKRASKMEMQDLNVNVWRSFKRKPYFIVLDDIWDIYSWGQLKSLFPDDKNGSRILFTSRNQELASQVKLNSISHPLELFDDGESWELIKNRVFGPSNCDKEFEKIGRKIASCCKGLPLAAALIAGVLGRTEHKLDSWNKVVENMKTHLSQEGCGNVLELSYKYLPDHLKPCFLYFAAFGRGKKPIAKRLKLLWIGEGFVNQYEGMKPSGKDLATEYLTDLVSLGLVMKERSSTKGGIKQCSIHDFLYDLCLEKAKENNFMHWAELNSCYEWNIHSSNGMVNCNHHRLSISKCNPFIKSTPIVARRDLPTSSLHSFLCTSYASRDSSLRFLESFKILTVLKLKLRIKEFPEVILSSICLRYLSLHFEEVIEAIPPTIANLWKLRTLIIRIRTYSLTMLPLVMWNMMSLRHVNIRNAFIDLLGFDPENSSKSNIESLGFIYSDDDYRTTTKFFSKFPNLRKLKYTTRKSRIQELLSIVGSLPVQLESLYFGFEGDIDENPHPIVWNFPKIRYLTKLKLYGTHISWSVLSEIGKHLPNLHVLKLFTGSCNGHSWKMEDGAFLNLIYLMLVNLSIEEFDISYCDDPLPCLEYLHLNFCKELVEIPPVFGEINTLKEIKVFRCSNELGASAIRILEERREFGNDSFQVFGEGEI